MKVGVPKEVRRGERRVAATPETVGRLIKLGFEKVSVSNAALRRPELVREMADAVGRQSVVVTLDVRKAGLLRHYTVCTHNGRNTVKGKPVDLAQQFEDLGAGEIVINNIDRDGMMNGYDLDLAREVRAATSIEAVAARYRELIESI